MFTLVLSASQYRYIFFYHFNYYFQLVLPFNHCQWLQIKLLFKKKLTMYSIEVCFPGRKSHCPHTTLLQFYFKIGFVLNKWCIAKCTAGPTNTLASFHYDYFMSCNFSSQLSSQFNYFKIAVINKIH